MNYPTSHLTPFLPALPAKAPFASAHRSLAPHTAKLLNTHGSIACTLLNSLASLFAHAFVCFQSLADSFCKIGGVGYPFPCAPEFNPEEFFRTPTHAIFSEHPMSSLA